MGKRVRKSVTTSDTKHVKLRNRSSQEADDNQSSSSEPQTDSERTLVSSRSLILLLIFINVLSACGIAYVFGYWQNKAIVIDTGKSVVPRHQNVSLSQHYSIDYEDVLRLRKENMKIYNYPYSSLGIDKRSNLSLQEFRDVYDGKWPVIITDVIPGWKASKWNAHYFYENYGKERVTMKAVDSSMTAGVSMALPLELFYKNTQQAHPDSWTYIGDELFIPMRPELRRQVGNCVYLEEDFYQLFPDEVRPWNCMLLWGTEYSRSTLHMDPYNWTGTNAVFRGRKRWKMYPPRQDEYFYIIGDQKSGFPLECAKYNSPIDAFDPDLDKYPLFSNAHALEFDQLPGELLIIPTGWFHQAFNAEETLAISSQVMNRNNFRVILEEIIKADNLPRDVIPVDTQNLSPQQQVDLVMSLLPENVLVRGEAVTKNILEQIEEESKKPYKMPF